MSTATITSKGQVTIPKNIRDELHLSSGDKLDFVIDNGVMKVLPMCRKSSEVIGMLSKKGRKRLSVEEMNDELKKTFRKKMYESP